MISWVVSGPLLSPLEGEKRETGMQRKGTQILFDIPIQSRSYLI